jgi:predicted nuclease of predicted toxin-antitoxin system
MRFLLDENISPQTEKLLKYWGFDVSSIAGKDMRGVGDLEVIRIAKKEKRVIVTQDLDFGRVYYFMMKADVGIIVIRQKRIQTVEMVNQALKRLFEFIRKENINEEIFTRSLTIITEKKIRIVTK